MTAWPLTSDVCLQTARKLLTRLRVAGSLFAHVGLGPKICLCGWFNVLYKGRPQHQVYTLVVETKRIDSVTEKGVMSFYHLKVFPSWGGVSSDAKKSRNRSQANWLLDFISLVVNKPYNPTEFKWRCKCHTFNKINNKKLVLCILFCRHLCHSLFQLQSVSWAAVIKWMNFLDGTL